MMMMMLCACVCGVTYKLLRCARLATTAVSRNVCSVRAQAFHGKQWFLNCCGPYASRLRVSCLQISDTEYS
jgi:hypothetical protein